MATIGMEERNKEKSIQQKYFVSESFSTVYAIKEGGLLIERNRLVLQYPTSLGILKDKQTNQRPVDRGRFFKHFKAG